MKRAVYRAGRLTVTPFIKPVNNNTIVGLQSLQLNTYKNSLIYIPKNYNPNIPAALAVMLHGSGGTAEQGLYLLHPYADAHNIILLAPASYDYTWDIIAGNSFDKDVIFLDEALHFIFEHYTINAAHIAIGGFSDGASYALCLGLTNGDIFKYIIAFSPGFVHAMEDHGNPAVFLSHGIHDRVLPINSCSRRIVPQLNKKELAVTYHEFDGGHEIPENIRQEAVQWFLGSKK